MGDFISNPSATLPGPKSSGVTLPAGRDRNKRITTSDFNALREALLDSRAKHYSQDTIAALLRIDLDAEIAERVAEAIALRDQVATAVLGGGVSVADLSTVQATNDTIARTLREHLSSLRMRVAASTGPDLARLTVKNLSGDMTAANWVPTAGIVVTPMTPEDFIAAEPEARIPIGFDRRFKILKIEIKVPNINTGACAITCNAFPGAPSFASIRNLTTRWFTPSAMIDRWASIASDNKCSYQYYADAYPTTTNRYYAWGSPGYKLNQVVHVPSSAIVGSAQSGALAEILSGPIQYVYGTPKTMNLAWAKYGFSGDALASAGTPLVTYLIDVVEITESKPTMYFRWDDSSAGHRAVSLHMRNGTKFGGGSLARPLPSTFGIIPENIDQGGLTRADLRAMAAEGSEIVAHGYGPGGSSSWGDGSSAYMTAQIQATQAIIDAEGWPKPWRRCVIYPGNNGAAKTTDGIRVSEVAESLGLFALGGGAGGYGFSLHALTARGWSLGMTANPTTTEGAQQIVDFMARSGLSLIIMGHVIADADFDAIMTVFADELSRGTSRIRTADLVGDAVRAGIVAPD